MKHLVSAFCGHLPLGKGRGTLWYPVRVLALVAMVVQVLLVAEHRGASAAKSFGDVPYDAQLGFLELCLGDDADPSSPQNGADCPICGNASVMAFAEPDLVIAPEGTPALFTAEHARCTACTAVALRLDRKHPIRAPPLA